MTKLQNMKIAKIILTISESLYAGAGGVMLAIGFFGIGDFIIYQLIGMVTSYISIYNTFKGAEL